MRWRNTSTWAAGRPAGGPPRPWRRHRRCGRRRGAARRASPGRSGISGSSSHTRDAPAGERRERGRRQLERPRALAGRLRPGEHRQQQVEVGGAAGHRPEHVDVGVGRAAADAVEVAALGDHAVARLEPERAAAVRRDAHRAADVGAELERREAGGDRRRRAARRAARDARDVPRVVRRAEELVEALHVARPARQVGLAEDDGAGLAQPGHRRRVVRRARGRSARPPHPSSGCRRSRWRP